MESLFLKIHSYHIINSFLKLFRMLNLIYKLRYSVFGHTFNNLLITNYILITKNKLIITHLIELETTYILEDNQITLNMHFI